MSVKRLRVDPFGFVSGTVGLSLAFFFVILAVTAPLAILLSSVGDIAIRYYLLVAIGYGAVMSQVARLEETNNNDESSFLQQMLNLIMSGLYYNGAVYLGVLMAVVAGAAWGESTAMVVAVLYGYWEMVTIEHLIPLSYGGAIVWIIGLLYGIHEGGQQVANRIREIEWVSKVESVTQSLRLYQEWPLGYINIRRLQAMGHQRH